MACLGLFYLVYLLADQFPSQKRTLFAETAGGHGLSDADGRCGSIAFFEAREYKSPAVVYVEKLST